MRWSTAAAAALLLSATGTFAAPARIRMLVASGDVTADGRALHDLRWPVMAGPDRLLFRASHDRIVREFGNATVIVRTGDRLWGSDGGAFGELSEGIAGPGDRVVFSTEPDGVSVPDALVRWSAGGTELLAFDTGMILDGAANAAGDVAYRTRRSMVLWQHGARSLVTVADRRTSNVRRFRWGPRLSPAGAVAFVGDLAFRNYAVLRWTAERGLEEVIRSGTTQHGTLSFQRARADGFDATAAIRDDGAVAFAADVDSATGVFLTPAPNVVDLAAKTGDLVEGQPLLDIVWASVEFCGDVVQFFAQVPDGWRRVQVVGGVLGFVQDESHPQEPSFRLERTTGIFERDGSTIRTLLQTGDLVEGEPVATIAGLAAGGQLRAAGATVGGRRALLSLSGRGARVLARDGDPAPRGGTLGFSGWRSDQPRASIDIAGDRIVFAAETDSWRAGVFSVAIGERIRTITTGSRSAGRFREIGSIAAHGDAVVIAAEGEKKEGIFLWESGRLRRIASEGHLPGVGSVRSAGRPALAAGRIVFAADVKDAFDRFILWTPEGYRAFRAPRDADDEPLLFSGAVDVTRELSLALTEDDSLMAWDAEGTRHRLIRYGTSAPSGGTVSGVYDDFDAQGRSVAVTALLSDDSKIRRALLEIRVP